MRNSVVFRSALICGVLAVAGYMYVLARNSLAMDKESSAFAMNTVVAVGAHWDPAELWQRATPHFREQTTQDALRAQFDAANGRLGPMTESLAIAGKTSFPIIPTGAPLFADYIVRSVFAKGEADIVVRTVKTGNTWVIDSFSIGASPEMRKVLGLRG
ncbi:MAG: hypothetical protein ABSB77_22080 [Xanthobacteraceae bacterium]|jgi:hypothetical protein